MPQVCVGCAQVSDASFLEAFQATKGDLDELIHHKVVTCLHVLIGQVACNGRYTSVIALFCSNS